MVSATIEARIDTTAVREFLDGVVILLRPGTPVQIGPKREIDAVVSKVCIEHGNVTYEAVWWSGNDRKTAWVQAIELLSSGEEKNELRIGFAQ